MLDYEAGWSDQYTLNTTSGYQNRHNSDEEKNFSPSRGPNPGYLLRN